MSCNIIMLLPNRIRYDLKFPFSVPDLDNNFDLFTNEKDDICFKYNPTTDRANFAALRAQLEANLTVAILGCANEVTSRLYTTAMVHCLNYWTFNDPNVSKLQSKDTPLLLMLAEMKLNTGDSVKFEKFVALRKQASKVTREVPADSTKQIEAQKYLDMVAELVTDVVNNGLAASEFALLVCKDIKWILGGILNSTPVKTGKDGQVVPAKPALLNPTKRVFANFDYNKFYDPTNPVYIKMDAVKAKLAEQLTCTKIYATNPTDKF